jgi:hypothetical protein
MQVAQPIDGDAKIKDFANKDCSVSKHGQLSVLRDSLFRVGIIRKKRRFRFLSGDAMIDLAYVSEREGDQIGDEKIEIEVASRSLNDACARLSQGRNDAQFPQDIGFPFRAVAASEKETVESVFRDKVNNLRFSLVAHVAFLPPNINCAVHRGAKPMQQASQKGCGVSPQIYFFSFFFNKQFSTDLTNTLLLSPGKWSLSLGDTKSFENTRAPPRYKGAVWG